jgi:hypothetical protein
LQLQGIDALARMVCDWGVAILDEAIHDPSRVHLVRRHALRQIGNLVAEAIRRGYRGIDGRTLVVLQDEAHRRLMQVDGGMDREEPAATDLCNHLSRAIEEGYFGQLQEF